MTLGERIAKRRKELNMSQDQLAKLIGYSTRASITLLENGTRDLPRSKVMPLARALGVSIDYIMGWEEEKKETPLERLKRETGVTEFSEEEKKEIIKYIKYLISLREK